MEPNNNERQEFVEVEKVSRLHIITPLSKYLAMALFITLPFLGGWVGYNYSPEKIVEVENIVVKEFEIDKELYPTKSSMDNIQIEDGSYVNGQYWKSFLLPWTDFEIFYPAGMWVDEEGLWTGVMYRFIDYWPKTLDVSEHLSLTNDEVYELLDEYYAREDKREEYAEFKKKFETEREKEVEGITFLYLYEYPNEGIFTESDFVLTDKILLNGREWQEGYTSNSYFLMSKFEKVYGLFLTEKDNEERIKNLKDMAGYIKGSGILDESHPGCCY